MADGSVTIRQGDKRRISATLNAAAGQTLTITSAPLLTVYDATNTAVPALTALVLSAYDTTALPSVSTYYTLDTAALPAGQYTAVYTIAVTDSSGGTETLQPTEVLNVSAAPPAEITDPLLYAHTLGPQAVGVGTWRSRLLRSLVDTSQPIGYDAITGQPSSTLLPGVFTADDLDDALRAALVPISDYRPTQKMLASLQLVSGTATYDLPLDFDEPDPHSWRPIIGPSSFETGQFPGSRYAWMRLTDTLNSPLSRNTSRSYGYGLGGGAFGYGFLGVGSVMDWGAGLVYDSNGELEAGSHQRHGAHFFGPDLDHANPYMMLVPTPQFVPSTPYTNLFYRASFKVYRLSVNNTNDGYAKDDSNLLVKTLPPSYSAFDPTTDVLSFMESDTEMMLSLLFAKWYLLSEKVLASADSGDSKTYSFFQMSTGMARKDIEKQAANALSMFQVRTSRKPRGLRG